MMPSSAATASVDTLDSLLVVGLIARGYRGRGLDPEDLISEGKLGRPVRPRPGDGFRGLRDRSHEDGVGCRPDLLRGHGAVLHGDDRQQARYHGPGCGGRTPG